MNKFKDRRKNMKIIVASGNKGKIKEIKEIFGNEFDIISIKDIGIDISFV